MNQAIYDFLEFSSKKFLFIFFCLKTSQTLAFSLGSIIKRAKLSKNKPINVPQNCCIYKTRRVNAVHQIPNAWYKFKALKTN